MNREQIIRAWKDEEYRSALSTQERALLPEHPAGVVTLSESDLEEVGGATLGAWCIAVYTYLLSKNYCPAKTLGCECACMGE